MVSYKLSLRGAVSLIFFPGGRRKLKRRGETLENYRNEKKLATAREHALRRAIGMNTRGASPVENGGGGGRYYY